MSVPVTHRISGRQVLHLLLITLIAFLPAVLIPCVQLDEGIWASMAQHLFSGELYSDISDNKPPFLIELYWLFSGGASSMQLAHYLTAFWVFLGGIFFYFNLQNYFQKSSAFISTSIYILLSGTLLHGAFSAELAQTPLLIFAWYLSEQIIRTPTSCRLLRFLGLGMVLSLAVNTKPTAVFFLVIPMVMLWKSLRISDLLFAFVAGLVTAGLSWSIVGARFHSIWSEVITSNMTYASAGTLQGPSAFSDILENISVSLVAAYGSVALGSLIALFSWIKAGIKWSSYSTVLLITTILVLLVSIGLGFRFYQHYFIATLPCLVLFSTFALEKSRWLRWAIPSLASISLLGFHLQILKAQALDENKNWNKNLIFLANEILNDAKPNERVWFSNSMGPVYFLTHRKPASKRYLFLHYTRFVSVCRASEDLLQEDLTNPNYVDLIERLEKRNPAVIFWAQNPKNSCMNRVHLDRFPRIKSLIEAHYDLKWQNKDGLYFRLRK
jgi:hypothetical protein